MKLAYIIQSRMNSERLPGKVLRPVAGKPMLQYLLESVRQCKQDGRIIVATSDRETDTPIATFCETVAVDCYRGELENVASRYHAIIRAYQLDAFVRICGDSPLLDHRLVAHGIALFRQESPDLVTNVLPRSFPKGQSVEVVNAHTFVRNYPKMKTKEDLEHTTGYFYRHKDRFTIRNFKADADHGHLQLSVDDKADFLRFSRIIGKLQKPHWQYDWQTFVSLSEACST